MRRDSVISNGWQPIMFRPVISVIVVVAALSGCATVPGRSDAVSQTAQDESAEPVVQTASHEVLRPELSVAAADSSNRTVVIPAVDEVSSQPLIDVHGQPLPSAPVWQQTVALVPPAEYEPNAAGGHGSLDPDQLVAEVLAANPSVEAMESAWRAAAMRYPQVTALDDPMFGVALGPGSWGSRSVDSAYMVMVSQQFPWPGKLRLKGDVANAESNAAARSIEDLRLQLAELTRLSCFDYYQAHRQRTLNAQNIEELTEFRTTAEAKLRASLVTQQDVLQADVELALLERRRLELDRQVQVAVARINTLLHRAAEHPLPVPPERDEDALIIPSSDELLEMALQQRPDLQALADRIQADRAELGLASADFYPDFNAYAKYDAFWQEQPLRPMIGVSLNVPLNKHRRNAAVHEAESRLQQHNAEYARLMDEIANQIQSILAHWQEARGTAELYSTRIVPAAEKNVASAQAGYVSGRIDFLRLIEAQRQLIDLREQQVEAEATTHRRLAELHRAVAISATLLTPRYDSETAH
ncbi:hypothetical protein GC176_27290 [bacterium]|nr:hypothetical protein [bacterium]